MGFGGVGFVSLALVTLFDVGVAVVEQGGPMVVFGDHGEHFSDMEVPERVVVVVDDFFFDVFKSMGNA